MMIEKRKMKREKAMDESTATVNQVAEKNRTIAIAN